MAPEANPEAMQEAEPEAADLTTPQNKQKLLYCERFVEFLTDLLSQLPTRRFIRTLLEDRAILTKCRMSALFNHPQGEAVIQPCRSQLRISAGYYGPCFVVHQNRSMQSCLLFYQSADFYPTAKYISWWCGLVARFLLPC